LIHPNSPRPSISSKEVALLAPSVQTEDIFEVAPPFYPDSLQPPSQEPTSSIGTTENWIMLRNSVGYEFSLVLTWPKSVAKITDDNINYQDGTHDKASAEDHDDQDNYLNDALIRDQNVGSINIIGVHLN